MASHFSPCLLPEQLVELPDLTDFDRQVKQHYVPLVIQHYHTSLLTNEKALTYLQQHYGIDEQVIEQYQLGFSDRSLGKGMPHHRTDEGGSLRGSLARLGVYKKATGHEAFRGCVVIPIITQGEVAGFYAERIGRPQRDAMPYYFAPSFLPCVFNLDAITSTNIVYMCSNPFVAIQMMPALTHTIATDKLFNLQDIDMQCLADKGVSKLVLCSEQTIPPVLIARLAKRLKCFGIKYECSQGLSGGVYGRA
jgi:hypothetical protein